MSTSDEVERLRKEHNAAMANGLVIKARRIARSLSALENAKACACIRARYCYDETGFPGRCWIQDGRPEDGGE